MNMLVVLFTFLISSVISLPVKSGKENLSIQQGTDSGLYNVGFYEGDILITNKTKKVITKENLARNAIKDTDMLWPHAAIVYKTEESVGCPESKQCELLMKAMNEYHKKSCIRFKEWTGEDDFVSIFLNPDSGSCWSPVGMVGDKQRLSLGERCWYFGIVVHELGHAVGFWHEMNRPDRDEYMVVNWENIVPGFSSAFRKMSREQVNLLGESLDFKSVMMYDEYAFSKDGTSATIQTKTGEYIGPLWKKNQLSESDVRRINKLYECQNTNQKITFPYNIHCMFNLNVCGFKNAEFTIWKWKVDSESSYIISTLESSGGTTGKFISPNMYPLSTEDKLRGPKGCIRFWSILEGHGTFSLTLKVETLDNVTQLSFNDSASKTVWSTKEISSDWKHQQITIDTDKPFRLTFESQFFSDATNGSLIALDEVEILYNGPCRDIVRNIPKQPIAVRVDPKSSEVIGHLKNITTVSIQEVPKNVTVELETTTVESSTEN